MHLTMTEMRTTIVVLSL